MGFKKKWVCEECFKRQTLTLPKHERSLVWTARTKYGRTLPIQTITYDMGAFKVELTIDRCDPAQTIEVKGNAAADLIDILVKALEQKAEESEDGGENQSP